MSSWFGWILDARFHVTLIALLGLAAIGWFDPPREPSGPAQYLRWSESAANTRIEGPSAPKVAETSGIEGGTASTTDVGADRP